jgi:hypothetical protein
MKNLNLKRGKSKMKKIIFLFLIIFSLAIVSQLNADTYSLTAGNPDEFGIKNAATGMAEFYSYPIKLSNLYSTNYTVPAGYSLIIDSIRLKNENDWIKIQPSIAIPETAPVCVPTTGTAIENDTETWTYKIEYYSEYNQVRSGYSDTYIQVNVNPTYEYVYIYGIPTSNNIAVNCRKVWRSFDTSTFYLVKTIYNNSDTAFNDTVTDTTLITYTTYTSPTSYSHLVATGKVNGDFYGKNYPTLKNSIGLNEYEVLSAANNNVVVTGYLKSTSNIWVTVGNLSTTNYNCPDTKYLVINNIFSNSPQNVYAKTNIYVPSSSFSGSETTGVSGAMDSGKYYYKIKYKSTLTNQESDLSNDSVEVTIGAGDTGSARLTSISVSGNAFINARDVYRSYVDNRYAFYYVGTIADNTTTVYTDSKNDTELGAIYSANIPVPIFSGVASSNQNGQFGEFLGKPIVIETKSIISSDKNSAVINGYLVNLK